MKVVAAACASCKWENSRRRVTAVCIEACECEEGTCFAPYSDEWSVSSNLLLTPVGPGYCEQPGRGGDPTAQRHILGPCLVGLYRECWQGLSGVIRDDSAGGWLDGEDTKQRGRHHRARTAEWGSIIVLCLPPDGRNRASHRRWDCVCNLPLPPGGLTSNFYAGQHVSILRTPPGRSKPHPKVDAAARPAGLSFGMRLALRWTKSRVAAEIVDDGKAPKR